MKQELDEFWKKVRSAWRFRWMAVVQLPSHP